MLYIIYCRDDPRISAKVRATHKDEHLAYLANFAESIVLGGAMLDEDGETRLGSTLILNANSLAEVEAFSQNEPFRRAGLYESVQITRMRRAQWRPERAPGSAEGN